MITLKMSTGKMKRINRAPNKEYVMEGFLEPGLVSYQDSGDGVSRLDKEAIDKMLPSFVGCPLVIEHTDSPKAEVLNGMKNEAGKPIKVGEVKKAWWNADTGRYDCSFTTEDEEALKKINDEGWSGSCAYNVREPLGPSGELHAMRYDNTILDGEFEHLALVPNPRYEDCTIRMNGKNAKIKENASPEKEWKMEYETLAAKSTRTAKEEDRLGFLRTMVGTKENAGETKLGTCPRCGVAGDNVDGNQTECTACGHKYTPGTKNNAIPRNVEVLPIKVGDGHGWAIYKDGNEIWRGHRTYTTQEEALQGGRNHAQSLYKNNAQDRQTMFDKERKEHPEFTDFQIWEIVEDHMKTNGAFDAKGTYKIYIDRAKEGGRDPREMLKTRFGLTKTEMDHVMGEYEKQNSVTNYSYATILAVITRLPKDEVTSLIEKGLSSGQLSNQEATHLKEKAGITKENAKFSVAVIPDNYGTSFYYVMDGNKKASAGYKKREEAEAEAAESERRTKENAKPKIERVADNKYAVVDGDTTLYVGTAEQAQRWLNDMNTKENAGLDQGPYGSTIHFESGVIKHKGYQIEQVADAKWKVWKGPRFLATLASEQEAKSFIDQKQNGRADDMADGILQDINPAQITEQACVNWALEMGYSKAEGQQAWQILFKGMRELNSKKNSQIQRGDSVHIMTSAAGVPHGTAGVVIRVSGDTLTVRTIKGDATVREGEVELIKESREFENGKVTLKNAEKKITLKNGPDSEYIMAAARHMVDPSKYSKPAVPDYMQKLFSYTPHAERHIQDQIKDMADHLKMMAERKSKQNTVTLKQK